MSRFPAVQPFFPPPPSFSDLVNTFPPSPEWSRVCVGSDRTDRGSGVNLRKTNDPALLKKALKRKAKKKSASAKAWNSRVEKAKDAVVERQRIRSHNLDQRKLGGATAANLSSKRIVERDAGEESGGDGGGGKDGKKEKRRRLGPHSNQGGNRAGFEGKKSGFINGRGGSGKGRGGGASSSSAAPGDAGGKGR